MSESVKPPAFPPGLSLNEQVSRWGEWAIAVAMEREGRGRTATVQAAGTQSTVYRILKGEGPFDLETLEAFAQAVGVPKPRIVQVLDFGTPQATDSPMEAVRRIKADLALVEESLKLTARPARDSRPTVAVVSVVKDGTRKAGRKRRPGG